MGVETERKFLVKSDAWRATAGAGTVMAQGYLADTERAVVRVRVAGSRGFLTVRAATPGFPGPNLSMTFRPVTRLRCLRRSHAAVL